MSSLDELPGELLGVIAEALPVESAARLAAANRACRDAALPVARAAAKKLEREFAAVFETCLRSCDASFTGAAVHEGVHVVGGVAFSVQGVRWSARPDDRFVTIRMFCGRLGRVNVRQWTSSHQIGVYFRGDIDPAMQAAARAAALAVLTPATG